jgi:hypothetical protein
MINYFEATMEMKRAGLIMEARGGSLLIGTGTYMRISARAAKNTYVVKKCTESHEGKCGCTHDLSVGAALGEEVRGAIAGKSYHSNCHTPLAACRTTCTAPETRW